MLPCCSGLRHWGFQAIRGPFLAAPIKRIIVCRGLYWPHIFLEAPISVLHRTGLQGPRFVDRTDETIEYCLPHLATRLLGGSHEMKDFSTGRIVGAYIRTTVVIRSSISSGPAWSYEQEESQL